MSDIDEFLSFINKFTDLARPNRYKVFFTPPPGLQPGGGTDILTNILSGLDGNNNDISRNLSLQCETAELPGRALTTRPVFTYGPVEHRPFATTYDHFTVGFFCTANRNTVLSYVNRLADGLVVRGLTGLVGSGVASELGDLAGGVLNRIEKIIGVGGQNNGGMWERQFFDDWMELIHPMETDSFNFNYPDDYVTNVVVAHYDAQDNPTVAYKYERAFPITVDHQALSWSDDSILMLNVTFAYKKWTRDTTDSLTSDSFLLNPISNLIDTVATSITGSSLAGRIGRDLVSANPLSRILNEF